MTRRFFSFATPADSNNTITNNETEKNTSRSNNSDTTIDETTDITTETTVAEATSEDNTVETTESVTITQAAVDNHMNVDSNDSEVEQIRKVTKPNESTSF